MLFGPWDGQDLVRAVHSRRDFSWAFVELHPSLLGQGAAARPPCARHWTSCAGSTLVCFIDEADEIASDRAERPDNQPLSTSS